MAIKKTAKKKSVKKAASKVARNYGPNNERLSRDPSTMRQRLQQQATALADKVGRTADRAGKLENKAEQKKLSRMATGIRKAAQS